MIDLKSLVILTILSACFGIASSDFLTDNFRRFFHKQIPKPFGCSFCMAFWGGLSYSIYLGNGFADSLFIGCAASVLSSFIYKSLNL
jgi:hypothetical protein